MVKSVKVNKNKKIIHGVIFWRIYKCQPHFINFSNLHFCTIKYFFRNVNMQNKQFIFFY